MVIPQSMFHQTKYCIPIPDGSPLEFPNFCPFTGAASPEARIRITAMADKVIPIPFVGMYRSTHRASLRLPASKTHATKLNAVTIAMQVFFVGGLIPFFIFLCSDTHDLVNHDPTRAIEIWLVLHAVAAFFWFFRYYLLRKVWLEIDSDSRLNLHVFSEDYAQQFAKLNRLRLREE